MRASTRLREAIHHTLHQTDNDLAAQNNATDFATRKRLHEMTMARDEDDWQKKNVSRRLPIIRAGLFKTAFSTILVLNLSWRSVFSTAFELRGADLPFFSWAENIFFNYLKKMFCY
jgi:hypothetical protein